MVLYKKYMVKERLVSAQGEKNILGENQDEKVNKEGHAAVENVLRPSLIYGW